MNSTSVTLIALLLWISACNRSDKNTKIEAALASEKTSEDLPELSIYNSTTSWQTQDSDTLQLKSLRGKIRVVAMMYTNCQYACPRLVADMKSIESSLGDSVDEIGFVLASIDTRNDTPEKLKRFAIENNLGSEWLLLHGSENDILELAAMLGVQYQRSSETDFAHSNVLSVLNEDGEIVYQQNGLGLKDETVATIKALVTP